MNPIAKSLLLAGFLFFTQKPIPLRGAEIFRVATYNVENYLDVASGTRPVKSAESKAKIVETIFAAKPDVIAFQEIGSSNALLELRSSLKSAGLDFPHWEIVSGRDTNIHVAVLSRFPFIARRPHTNENFLLDGRRFQVARGFAEIDVQVNANYSFTLLGAHLKSRRPAPEADEAELREQEALRLRGIIDARLSANPKLHLIVLGDFNDVKNSRSTKTILGHGKNALFDTRPAERNGDSPQTSNSRLDVRKVTWTHFYSNEDTYSRFDYILVSGGMKREWLPGESFIVTVPDWGLASDHRLLLASFIAEER